MQRSKHGKTDGLRVRAGGWFPCLTMPCAKSSRVCSVCLLNCTSVPGEKAIHSTTKATGARQLIDMSAAGLSLCVFVSEHQVKTVSSLSVLGGVCWEGGTWKRQLPEGAGYGWSACISVWVEGSRVGSQRLISHEKIQSVCGCPCAHMHTDRNEENRDQLLGPQSSCCLHMYVPITDLHPDQPDEDMRCKQSCLGLPWMPSGSICADMLWPWPWSCAYQSCTPLIAHGEGTLMLHPGWQRQHWSAAPHFYQAWIKIQNPRSFAKLYALLHCKPLKKKKLCPWKDNSKEKLYIVSRTKNRTSGE